MRKKHSTLRHGLCGLLALFMVVDPNAAQRWTGAAQQPVRAAEPGPQPTKDAAAKPTAEDLKRMADEMERGFKALEAAEKEIPRDTFDPKAIVDKVGKDPVKLFEWVRDNTYWVPYRGALRGHMGVLMDRLGSSLDRSLLLAELLRVAGHKARLARAKLTEEQAKTLLPKIRAVPKNPLPLPAPTDQKELENLLDKYAKDFKLDGTALRKNAEKAKLQAAKLAEEVVQRVADQAPVIAKAVGSPTAKQAEATRISELALQLESVRDHWWVQRQDGARWVDLDVLLPTSAPSNALAKPTEQIVPDAKTGQFKLDSKFCHEVQIRVIVEQWKKGKLAENAALSHTMRPSELFGQRIALNHIPTNWPKDLDLFKEKEPLQKLKTTMLAQNEWLPVLMVGADTIAQSSFSDSGAVYKDGLQMLPGFAKAVANFDPFGAAKDAVEKKPRPKTESMLTAEWIEYQIRSPGQKTHTIRRQIFDLLGPAARLDAKVADLTMTQDIRLDRGLNLLDETEILPLVCQLSPDYVGDLTAKNMLANRRILTGFIGTTKLEMKDLAELAGKVTRLPGKLYDLALARQQWNQFRGDVYLDQVNVLSYHSQLRQGKEKDLLACHGFDIVSNDIAVRPGMRMDPFLIRLEQGVVDTNAESVLMAECGKAENTAEFLAAARDRGIEWLTIRTTRDSAWREVELPRDVRARIEQDLAVGYVVLVPARTVMPEGRHTFAWWRVDPKSGGNLGMLESGGGQATTEEKLVNSLAVTMVFSGLCFVVMSVKDIASLRGTIGHVGGQYSGQLITCALGAVGAGLGAFGATGLLAKLLATGIAGVVAGGKNIFN